jgi:YidC/Oxa1 family membrane protein insertase
MNSSRSTTIAIFLILLIFFGWMIFNQPKPTPKPAQKATPAQDTQASAPKAPIAPVIIEHSQAVKADSSVPLTAKQIETPLVSAEISSKGGSISRWVLKHYLTWDKKPLDLIDQSTRTGDAQLRFIASDGKPVSTADLNFTLDDAKSAILTDKDTIRVNLKAQIDSFATIEKTLTFAGNSYLVGVRYHLVGMQNKLAGFRYSLQTANELPYAEQFPDQESVTAKAFVMTPGGKEEINVDKPEEPQRKNFNGDITYVASRTKYFEQAVIPISPRALGAEVSGIARPLTPGHHYEAYSLAMQYAIGNANNDTIRANYYLGPLEYERISSMDPSLDETMDFGWRFLVRPISIHVLFPFFMFLHSFIGNWGLVVIVFSIFAKLLTYPLSTGQMKSMRKMQAIMPEVNKIKEQYKDEPKKLQEETFKVYRSYGVNPAGGCLPLLLQMPILFALYSVLVNVIELRQASFIFWIQDLSVPDRLIDFGATSIPLLGNHISGLTIFMTVTMVIQSITTTTDERQKKMAYIMPFLFMFLFNNLPSGVALYYFMFNIFGLAQQYYNKKFLPPLDLNKLKEEAKGKKGFMAKMQDMEKNARQIRQGQMSGNGQSGKKTKKK